MAKVLVVPLDACCSLAVFKSPTSVQLVPSQDSVLPDAVPGPGGVAPPIAKPDVYIQAPDVYFLVVFKSLTSVQVDPFHDSVAPVKGCPPNAKALVAVPRPPN